MDRINRSVKGNISGQAIADAYIVREDIAVS